MASSTVSQAASPIVKAGKMMWNEMVKANCSRDRRSAVGSIGQSPVRSGVVRDRWRLSGRLRNIIDLEDRGRIPELARGKAHFTQARCLFAEIVHPRLS